MKTVKVVCIFFSEYINENHCKQLSWSMIKFYLLGKIYSCEHFALSFCDRKTFNICKDALTSVGTKYWLKFYKFYIWDQVNMIKSKSSNLFIPELYRDWLDFMIHLIIFKIWHNQCFYSTYLSTYLSLSNVAKNAKISKYDFINTVHISKKKKNKIIIYMYINTTNTYYSLKMYQECSGHSYWATPTKTVPH